MVRWQLQARQTWRYDGVCGIQESGESSRLGKGDIDSQVGAEWKERGVDGDDPWQSKSLSECVRDPPKGYVPLGIYREVETKGLIDGKLWGLLRCKELQS